MTITFKDARILMRAGFTKREVDEFNKATQPDGKPQPPIDINSDAWRGALAKRRAWTDRIRAEYSIEHNRQLSPELYERIVNEWYSRSGKRNPFIWLTAGYRKVKPRYDFMEMARKRQKAMSQIYRLRRSFKK